MGMFFRVAGCFDYLWAYTSRTEIDVTFNTFLHAKTISLRKMDLTNIFTRSLFRKADHVDYFWASISITLTDMYILVPILLSHFESF